MVKLAPCLPEPYWMDRLPEILLTSMDSFSKYTSYSSKTNLLSASFFNSAVNTTVNGTWKDKILLSQNSAGRDCPKHSRRIIF